MQSLSKLPFTSCIIGIYFVDQILSVFQYLSKQVKPQAISIVRKLNTLIAAKI